MLQRGAPRAGDGGSTELEGDTPGRRGSMSGIRMKAKSEARPRPEEAGTRASPAASSRALGAVCRRPWRGGWSQNETRGTLSAAPAPARDPRGPRLLYLAWPSRHPGLLHQGPHWHSGRERERAAGAGCRGQAVARVLAAGRGTRVGPGSPLRRGSGRAAGFPRAGVLTRLLPPSGRPCLSHQLLSR